MTVKGRSHHRRSSFTEGHLPPKVVIHRRLSSTEGFFSEGRLSQKVFFHQRLSSIYHNFLVHLAFVRTVKIPNISLLPCLEVALISFGQMKHTRRKPHVGASPQQNIKSNNGSLEDCHQKFYWPQLKSIKKATIMITTTTTSSTTTTISTTK